MNMYFFVLLRLPESAMFILLEVCAVEVSWGLATAFIQRRSEALPPGKFADPKAHMNDLFLKWQ